MVAEGKKREREREEEEEREKVSLFMVAPHASEERASSFGWRWQKV